MLDHARPITVPLALRGPRALAAGGLLLAGGWLALAVVLCAHSLWDVPSQMAGLLPALYQPIGALLPAEWVNAPRDGPWVGGPLSAALLYLALMSGLWAVYLGAARAAATPDSAQARPPRALLAGIIAAGLGFGGLAVLWPGLFSSDMFYYAALGKMQVVYGLNPLVQPPLAMGNDPWLATIPVPDQRSPYGPVWVAITWLVGEIAQASGGDLVVAVLGFRLLDLGVLILATSLVWAIGGQLGWTNGRRAGATVLMAWCPLTITELAGNAHNDALLVLALLLAIWLHLRGGWPLAVAALVLGGLVKLPGFFLLPAYGVLLLRTSTSRAEAAWRLVGSLGVAALVAVVAYAPYAQPALAGVLLSNPNAGFLAGSLVNVLHWAIIDGALALRGLVTPTDLTPHAVSVAVRWPLWYGALGLWGLLACYFTAQVRDFDGLLRAWALTLFSYLLIGSAWFQPWYVVWLMPLAALLPSGPLRRALLLLALGASLGYAVIPYLPGDTTRDLRHFYVPAVVFLPALVYCAWEARRAWAGRRPPRQAAPA